MSSGKQIERLYTLLGVEPGVSAENLKKAFRRKAKEIHPDRSNETDANEKFLALHEAYDFLSKLVHPDDPSVKSSLHVEELYKTWEQKERQRVRQQVKDQLKKKYTGNIRYINDPIYEALEIVFVHFTFLLALFSVTILPMILILTYGSTGIFMSVLANVFLLLFTMSAVRNLHRLNIRSFRYSFALLVNTKPARTILFISFNALVFFIYGINTLINLTHLFWGYTVISIVAVLIILLKQRGKNSVVTTYDVYFWSLNAAPTLMSFLLIINFIFSSSPVSENYTYTAHTRNSYVEGGVSHKRRSGLIELENGVYSSYTGIRLFINGTNLCDQGTITYTIEKGALGFNVLKHYQLSNSSD